MTSLTFTVPGEPVPWARSRSRGKQYFHDAKRKEARAMIQWLAREAYRLSPMRGSVRMVIEARRIHQRRIDVDNICKMIMDSLNGIVYLDDSQIDDLRIVRHHVTISPCTIVTVSPINQYAIGLGRSSGRIVHFELSNSTFNREEEANGREE